MKPEKVDFSGGWDNLWARMSASMPPNLTILMLWAAAAMVAVGCIQWIWAQQGSGSGGGKASKRLLFTLILAAILASPGAVIPMMLGAIDTILNFVLDTLTSTDSPTRP